MAIQFAALSTGAKALGGQVASLVAATGITKLGAKIVKPLSRKIGKVKKKKPKGKKSSKNSDAFPVKNGQPIYAYPAQKGYVQGGAIPTAQAVPVGGWSGFKQKIGTSQGRRDIAFSAGKELTGQLAVMGALTGGMAAYQNHKNKKRNKNAESGNYGYESGAGFDMYGGSGYGQFGASLGGPAYGTGYGGGYGNMNMYTAPTYPTYPTYPAYNGTPIRNDYAFDYY